MFPKGSYLTVLLGRDKQCKEETHDVFFLGSRRCVLPQLLKDFYTGTVLYTQNIWSKYVIRKPWVFLQIILLH